MKGILGRRRDKLKKTEILGRRRDQIKRQKYYGGDLLKLKDRNIREERC